MKEQPNPSIGVTVANSASGEAKIKEQPKPVAVASGEAKIKEQPKPVAVASGKAKIKEQPKPCQKARKKCFSGAGGNADDTPSKVVDFQPDALEIKNQPLPGYIRFGVWFPLLAVAGAIIWACLAKTDVVIQGSGKLVTDQPTIVMKPLERSVIKEVNVKIGDVVEEGDVLITFDPEFNRAEAERVHNEVIVLAAQLARFQAEFYDKEFTGKTAVIDLLAQQAGLAAETEDPDFLADVEQFAKWQLEIYEQRRGFYLEKIRYYDEVLNQLDASRKSKEDSLRKQKERLETMQQLENMYATLEQKKAAPLKDLLQVQISRMEMETVVDQLANDLIELQHQRETMKAEKNSFIQEWRNKISEEMVNVDRNLTSASEEYKKQAQLLKYVCLKAPCRAVVHEIAAFSPGSAVREAEALITLIPLDGRIELEAEIRPEDIGKVQIGAEARVKLTAYPFQKYGTLNGVVRTISEDTLDKSAGNGPSVKYYRARLTVNGKLNGVKKSFRLIPGMESQCEIKCGRRRVIEYVLYPLIKALDETAREP